MHCFTVLYQGIASLRTVWAELSGRLSRDDPDSGVSIGDVPTMQGVLGLAIFDNVACSCLEGSCNAVVYYNPRVTPIMHSFRYYSLTKSQGREECYRALSGMNAMKRAG